MKSTRCVPELALLTAVTLALAAPRSSDAQEVSCPGASAADAESGWAAYRVGEIDAARTSFQTALSRCEGDNYARTGLAYVALRDGETERAAGLFGAVVDAEPENVDALVGLGLAAWRRGDLASVEARFQRVASLAPGHPTAAEYLGRLAGARERGPQPGRDPADAAWTAGDTNRAERLYSERLARDSADAVALLRLGLARAWREEYAGALELLDRLVTREPNNMEARVARARVHAWAGDLLEAEAEARHVLALQPDNVDALTALAQFQWWAGRTDAALTTYDAALAIAPDDSDVGRQRARAVANAEGYEQSIAAYESLVSRNPGDVEARLGLATALAYTGDHDAALGQYDEVLALAPGETRASVGRARVLGWAGRLVDAERAALRAVEADPGSGTAWAMLGRILQWQGRPADAREALEAATARAPTDPEMRDQLRAVRLALAPRARPTVIAEGDSDGNRMLTSALSASWHPVDRLEVRASGYHRRLELPVGSAVLERSATGASFVGEYQLPAGWRVSAGAGGSVTDGTGTGGGGSPSFVSFEAGARTPEQFPLRFGVTVSSIGLDATAALAERGVRSTGGVISARWIPAPDWRVDGTVGLGRYEGTEANARRSASLVASRRIGSRFTLGTSWRGFSFEKNLNDGYFDPDFYGVAELTGRWLQSVAPWSFLVELAPGIQQVGADGEAARSLRSNARVTYGIGAGREISLAVGYSTAGLTQFASGESGYDYTAFILGFGWAF